MSEYSKHWPWYVKISRGHKWQSLEIMNMPAGREMDVLAHREIFNKSCHSLDREILLPHYSTDIADAWLVVEKIKEYLPGREIMIYFVLDKWCVGSLVQAPSTIEILDKLGEADTAPLAICRAALIAIMDKTT